jgi:hypothetical protein
MNLSTELLQLLSVTQIIVGVAIAFLGIFVIKEIIDSLKA